MSAADVEILARMWEEFAGSGPSTDFAGFVERWWHPDLVYEEDPRWPGAATYEGRDDARAAFEGYREVLGDPELSVERVVEAGGRIVALVRFVGRSPGADVPWDHVWGYDCRIRDGKLIHLRAYWDPQEALEPAGGA
ncbi:MAG: nuclear transport factor 2 family protein [Solirubrobacterales bacterium]